MWFPTEGLNEGMITFMNVLPFRNATQLVQNTMNGINDVYKDLLIPLSIVLAYAIASFVLAIVAFKRKMKSN
jgi:ABC-type transport system involved in multi-copper enzyme maturation permease subunit